MAEIEVEAPQSEVLTEEEVAQVVEGEPQEEEVILPSDQETFELPEKFKGKTAEEIAKAYIELEKMKKGGDEQVSQGEEETPPSEEEEPNEKPNDPIKDLDTTKYEEKFIKEGKLDDADYAELEKLGISKEQVDEEIEYRQWKQEKAVKSLLEPIGMSQDDFKELSIWIAESKTPEEVAEINATLASAPKLAQQALIKTLHSEYSSGDSGPIHTNAPQSRPSKGYATQEEFFKDVGSSEYQNNPKFRQAVEAKMAISDIF